MIGATFFGREDMVSPFTRTIDKQKWLSAPDLGHQLRRMPRNHLGCPRRRELEGVPRRADEQLASLRARATQGAVPPPAVPSSRAKRRDDEKPLFTALFASPNGMVWQRARASGARTYPVSCVVLLFVVARGQGEGRALELRRLRVVAARPGPGASALGARAAPRRRRRRRGRGRPRSAPRTRRPGGTARTGTRAPSAGARRRRSEWRPCPDKQIASNFP